MQVVAHAQGGHAVDTGLEEFLGFAIAELVGHVTPLLLAAATGADHQDSRQPQWLAQHTQAKRCAENNEKADKPSAPFWTLAARGIGAAWP